MHPACALRSEIRGTGLYKRLKEALAQCSAHLHKVLGPSQAARPAATQAGAPDPADQQGQGVEPDPGPGRGLGPGMAAVPQAGLIQQLIIYGLGSPEASRTSRYQVALKCGPVPRSKGTTHSQF